MGTIKWTFEVIRRSILNLFVSIDFTLNRHKRHLNAILKQNTIPDNYVSPKPKPKPDDPKPPPPPPPPPQPRPNLPS